MAAPKVWTFFYGSYMNLDVLKQVDVVPGRHEAATVESFDIRIRPLATLVRSEGSTVHGIVATLTHEELKHLYAHARDVLGGTYHPEAVLAVTRDGRQVPALCYVSHDMVTAPASDDYLDRIVEAAKAHDFPATYIERLEAFRP